MLTVVISQYVSLTGIKIFFARMLYKIIHLFLSSDTRIISRNGIKYFVDISEGVDFALFLLGRFQKHVLKTEGLKVSSRPVIIDVGANIGHMTLEFAHSFRGSTVYAFEPTNYAHAKLLSNLNLNPELKSRIHVKKAIVTISKSGPVELQLYSSWKLNEKNAKQHKIHKGFSQSTSLVEVISIDSFCSEQQLEKVDLIKIDTDGSELGVLRGSINTLRTFKPTVIFEIGLYLLEEINISFEQYFNLFAELGYTIRHTENLKVIDLNNYKSYIPKYGTIDLVASSHA